MGYRGRAIALVTLVRVDSICYHLQKPSWHLPRLIGALAALSYLRSSLEDLFLPPRQPAKQVLDCYDLATKLRMRVWVFRVECWN